MKVLEMIAAMHEEIQKRMFPACPPFQRAMVGMALGVLDFKAGQWIAQNSEMLSKFGIIDANGDVDLDCAEAALRGLEWPLNAGPFTFTTDHLKEIMQAVRARVKKNPEPTAKPKEA